MAKAKKKTTKAKSKKGLLAKVKALIPRKKASPGRAIKNALKTKTSGRLSPAVNDDPAHAPGHRRMQLKESKSRATDTKAAIPRDEQIAQKRSNQRRIINGAAIGKNGRMA